MPNQHREVIDHFTGPYAFLSNFQPCRVTFYDYDTTASETPWPSDPDAK